MCHSRCVCIETTYKNDEVDFFIDVIVRDLFCVGKDPLFDPVPDKVYEEAVKIFLACHPGFGRFFFVTFQLFFLKNTMCHFRCVCNSCVRITFLVFDFAYFLHSGSQTKDCDHANTVCCDCAGAQYCASIFSRQRTDRNF